MLRIFGFSIAVTVLGLIGGFLLGGPATLAIVAILIVLEISLSFDNAVINAKILNRMSHAWQTIFLTIGVLIAVFGMRLVFPLVLVGITAGIGPVQVIDLALAGGEGPGSYAARLDAAHPAIAGFGGMFLGMLFLEWLFDDERERHWLRPIERPLSRASALDGLAVVVAGTGLVSAAYFLAGDDASTVMIAGLLGMVVYLLVNGLGNLFEQSGNVAEAPTPDANGRVSEAAKATGKAGFFLFLYLEVLDASFSFDGVVGAFAVSQDIFVIAIGLGVGAFWIRSLTIYLVRRGTLDNYIYLEHGAHWAIGALAVLLLVTIRYEVPELITGLIGVGFIAFALLSSIRHNRRHPDEVEHLGSAGDREAVRN